MSSVPEPAPPWPVGDEVPTEELARRQGVRPLEKLETHPHPHAWQSDQEFQDFLNDLYASRRCDAS